MTKQYIQNNTIFVVEYDGFMLDEHVPGYKLQQKDPTILWRHIMRILPARIQCNRYILIYNIDKDPVTYECSVED